MDVIRIYIFQRRKNKRFKNSYPEDDQDGVIRVSEKDKIEIARSILNNAANINISRKILLKISQKIDKYIVEYFRKSGGR